MALTNEEVNELKIQGNNLISLGNVLHALADSEPDSLSRLKPTGNLSKLAGKIRENTPITDDDFNSLVAAAKQDIKGNSRLNGLVLNIAHIAQLVAKTVLPLA